MDFSSPLQSWSSSLHLTWKQHKVIRTRVCSTIRSEVADVTLGGRGASLGPWRQHVSWKETETAGGRVTFKSKCVTMTERQTRLPGRPPDAFDCGMCRRTLAGLGQTHSSIFFTAQYLPSVPAFVAQNIPKTPEKCGKTTGYPPLSLRHIYIPLSVHRLGFSLPRDHPADID